jgi:hypothetical protein
MKSQSQMIFLLFIGYVVVYIDKTVMGFALLPIEKEFGLSTAQLGYITGIFFLAYSLFQVPAGWLNDKIGFYVCRQGADTRDEHQDDGVSYSGHVRKALQGRLQDEAKRIAQDAQRTPPGRRMRTGQDGRWVRKTRTFQDETITSGRCEQDAAVNG